MTKLLLIAVLSVVVTACGGGGSSSPTQPTNPVQPPPTPPTPPPPVEVLEVSIDDTFGDRFKPVVVTVDYTIDGEPAEWTHDVGTKVDDRTLHIYGLGYEDYGYVTINDEEYQFSFRAEPRCVAEQRESGVKTDCMGYMFRGPLEGFIYYGEDDDQMVTVELGIFLYDGEGTTREFTDRELSTGEQQRAERMVGDYNEFFAQSGVHIEFVLKEVRLIRLGSLQVTESMAAQIPVDIVIAWGTSYTGTCGVAFPNTSFPPGYPPVGMSRCGTDTDLHELGHAVGLAHGPQNSDNAASGYIWPTFGHGWNELCRGTKRDLMAYGGTRRTFWNSLLSCAEMFPQFNEDPDRRAGSRQFADSAYHWNRVRYDLSLVNDERQVVLYDIIVRPERPLIPD